MADTLTFKKELTGHQAVDLEVVTDGTDIFWNSGTFSGDIYKYTVSTDSFAKLVDASNFNIDDGNSFGDNFTMMVYAGNIYVGIWFDSGGFVAGDKVAKVYKVTPEGAVSTVISDFPKSANATNATIRAISFRLHSTEDHVVATYIEWPSAGSPDPAEFKSQWSTDGTSWGNTTDSFSEVINMGALQTVAARGKDYRALGIHGLFPINSTTVVILKFVNGTWSKVAGPSATADLDLFEVGPVHFWMDNDFSRYTDDFITFHEPDSQNPACLGLNMPFATGDSVDDDADFVKLNTASPPTGLTVDSTMATSGIAIGVHTEVMIRLNDGTGFMVGKDFITAPEWSIWERTENLGATPGAWGGAGSQSEAPAANRPCDINVN